MWVIFPRNAIQSFLILYFIDHKLSAILVPPLQDTGDVEPGSHALTGGLLGDGKDMAFLDGVLPSPTLA